MSTEAATSAFLKGFFPLSLRRPKSVLKGEMSRASRLEGRLRAEEMMNLLPSDPPCKEKGRILNRCTDLEESSWTMRLIA